GLRTDHALAGLRLGLARYGLHLDVPESGGDGAGETGRSLSGTVTPAADPAAAVSQYWQEMAQFMHDGLAIPAQAFWNVYYRANAGLYPDTPISRQHTGATVKDVLQPGQELTKQFSEEELLDLADPDDADNQNAEHFSPVAT